MICIMGTLGTTLGLCNLECVYVESLLWLRRQMLNGHKQILQLCKCDTARVAT